MFGLILLLVAFFIALFSCGIMQCSERTIGKIVSGVILVCSFVLVVLGFYCFSDFLTNTDDQNIVFKYSAELKSGEIIEASKCEEKENKKVCTIKNKEGKLVDYVVEDYEEKIFYKEEVKVKHE